MNPLVTRLEEKLLPEFRKIAEKIRQEISNVRVSVYSTEIGSETQFQGHDFCIDCLFLGAFKEDETDNVALMVNLGYLKTIPRIDADVGWGYPSGKNEASFKNWGGIFPDEGIIVSDEILEDLYKDLPRLYEALFKALRRRKPSDE
jgi:hypothetical protein